MESLWITDSFQVLVQSGSPPILKNSPESMNETSNEVLSCWWSEIGCVQTDHCLHSLFVGVCPLVFPKLGLCVPVFAWVVREPWQQTQANVQEPVNQERKRHIKLKKIVGTPAGCPWDTRRDKQGSTDRCPRDVLFFCFRETDRKGQFCRDTSRVSQRHPGVQAVFRKST